MTARLPPGWVPAVARRQGGLFTGRQAAEGGATPAQVRRRITTGRWERVLGDALALHPLAPRPAHHVRAVALTWPDAVVCFGSAAAFHGFPVRPEHRTHVIVPRRLPGRGGIVTHTLRLDPGEVVRAAGGLVTSRQRTLFDCIGRLELHDAEQLVAWAVTREVLSPEALEDALRRRAGWWGNAARRQALDDARRGTLSAAERRLARLLRRGRVTGWACDQRLWDEQGLIGRADVLFPEARLVIEVDGYAHHGQQQFQRDRVRQNRLVAAGYTVLRFTWVDLTDRPQDVLSQIRHVLRRLGVVPAPASSPTPSH